MSSCSHAKYKAEIKPVHEGVCMKWNKKIALLLSMPLTSYHTNDPSNDVISNRPKKAALNQKMSKPRVCVFMQPRHDRKQPLKALKKKIKLEMIDLAMI